MRKEKTSENLRNLRNLRQLFIGGCFPLHSNLLQTLLLRARSCARVFTEKLQKSGSFENEHFT